MAGANLFERRWNSEFKQVLRESRLRSTANVVLAITKSPRRADGSPKVLVNASATGYYGPHGDEELTEDSPPAADYLAKLCLDWEQAARAVESSGVRGALVRIGIVLDKEGGALAQLLTPFRMGAGAGDAFVGAMMGYLASAKGSVENHIRRAMVYGSVTASFCCEGFGLTCTTKIKRAQIDRRVKELEKLTRF